MDGGRYPRSHQSLSREAELAATLKVAAAEHFGEMASEFLLGVIDEREMEQDYVVYTNLEFFENFETPNHNRKLQ